MAKPASIGIWKKAVFSLIPAILLLVSAEAVLRLAGYRSPIEDPWESFAPSRPLFERRGNRMVLSPARSRFFHPQEFATFKPPGLVRGFVVGGSTTWGHGLKNPSAGCYAGLLRGKLEARLRAPVEVINCGAGSYASYRLTRVVEEIVEYAPDFIVVMTGHNEFLEPIHYAELMEANRFPWYFRFRIGVALRTLAEKARPIIKLPAARKPAVGLEPHEKYIVRDANEFSLALEH